MRYDVTGASPHLILVLAGVLLLSAPASSAEPAVAPAFTRKPILDVKSHWRYLAARQAVFVRLEGGENVPLETHFGAQQYQGVYRPLAKPKEAKLPKAPAIPAGWSGPEFDDAPWALHRGVIKATEGRDPVGLSLILMRSRFLVDDPAAVGDLELSLRYRGGVIAYLNGTEAARGHMPAGPAHGGTMAEAYTQEASLFPENHKFAGRAVPEGAGLPEQRALRDRSLARLKVPSKLLRKGVNVLALELHVAPRAEGEMTTAATTQFKTFWAHVGLLDLSLTAPSAAGLIPNCPGAAGFDAAPVPATFRLDETAYGDRADRGPPLRIVGCRNGSFSGQIVVSSDEPFQGLHVACANLEAIGGDSRIPASAIELRYPRAEWVDGTFGSVFGFDALEDDAPAVVDLVRYETRGRERQQIVGRAVQPVWLNVRVPPETPAATYVGTITVSASGQTPVDIPLEVRIIGWTMADTKEWASFIDIIQSPDTLVETYKTPLWSEEHWKLVDRSFDILGRVGNKTIWVPVIAQTHLGNEHGMVRWVKKNDGTYDYDFTVMDRYLDTAIKHLGKVPVVEFLVWDLAAGWQWTGHDVRDKDSVQVSVLDPKTGQLSLMKAPPFGTLEAREFWGPLYEALRQRMAKPGMTASQMTGASFDRTPLKAALDDIHAAAPDFGWGYFGHMWATKVWDKPCGYRTHVYSSWDGWDGEGRLKHKHGWNWDPGKIVGELCRAGSNAVGGQSLHDDRPLGQFRASSEYLTTSGTAGQGRVGGDFWPCIGRPPRSRQPVFNRYWPNDWVHLSPLASVYHLLAPGKKGAVSTVRFEMVRQGMQEVEARIFLEKALLDPARRARLGEDLAARAQKVLEDRNRALRDGMPDRDVAWGQYLAGVDARAVELYAVAASVADRLARQ